VEVDHEPIEGMMPHRMVMEFYVTSKKELEALKVGDKVSFTLEESNKSPKITKISKIE
jgi:Cu/Ag efflux protein CusF